MNQILNTKERKEKIKKIFQLQLAVSVVLIVFGFFYIIRNIKEKERENHISSIISLNAKLNSVFATLNQEENAEIYFGRLICDKIGLDYYVYNQYSEENLKILPCKFSGRKIRREWKYMYYRA